MAFLAGKFQSTIVARHEDRTNFWRATLYAALLAGTLIHFVGLDRTLWLDETGTGAIAAQNSIGDVFRQILSDINAPLYYIFMHFWGAVFGFSNVALRLPSAIFAAAAAWVVVIGRAPLDKDTKLFWAVLLALWIPGFNFAHEARCYAMLFFLATCNALFFARLVAEPERKVALAWAGIGLALILTHYYGFLLIAAQIVLLFAWHRAKLLPLWPALLVFTPLVPWMAFHIGHVLRYLDPHVSWYWLLAPGDLWKIADFLTNYYPVAALALLMLLLGITQRAKTPKPMAGDNSIWLVVIASLLPALLVVAIGFVRPCFTFRYLMPFGPGILLGVALAALQAKQRFRVAPLVMLLTFAGFTIILVGNQAGSAAKLYSFERASQALIEAKTERLVFLWDNPDNQVIDPQLAAAMGGFFFKRAGVPVVVTPMRLQAGDDPNARLVAEAQVQHAAILWVYDTTVNGTAARAYPASIERRDKSWTCRDFGKEQIGIVACRVRTGAAPE